MKKISASPQAWGVAAEYIQSFGIQEATERVISQMQGWIGHLKYFLQLKSVYRNRKIVYTYLDQPLALRYKGEQFPVNTAYDVLGRILSVCGPGPPGATAKNYSLPMIALYSKRCSVPGNAPLDMRMPSDSVTLGNPRIICGSYLYEPAVNNNKTLISRDCFGLYIVKFQLSM